MEVTEQVVKMAKALGHLLDGGETRRTKGGRSVEDRLFGVAVIAHFGDEEWENGFIDAMTLGEGHGGAGERIADVRRDDKEVVKEMGFTAGEVDVAYA